MNRLYRAIRVAVKVWLARHRAVIEFCKDCGVEQPVVWTAPDDLWTTVTGRSDGGGILCPNCFDRRAAAQGRLLRWVPQDETR